ncbi:MAG: hypothetical protein JSU72_11950 [Deltaproteobacteria bacterium]|nr:MAG: hypothetical protein JSU72_11950 [Deltaproteobacteria bacterium]
MAVFVGGIVAAVLGIILLLIWWVPFLQLLAGAVPVMLFLGGAIAAYLGFDEVKDKLPYFGKKEQELSPTMDTDETPKYREEAEKYKAEVDELKSELDKLKQAEEQKE